VGASPAYGVDEMAYALETANKESLFKLPGGCAIGIVTVVGVGTPRGEISLPEGSVTRFKGAQELVEV